MITDITERTLPMIKNRKLRTNAEVYVRIYQDFMEQIRSTGIEIDEVDDSRDVKARLAALAKKGIEQHNNKHSLSINEVSTACKACRLGVGSATFFISLECHRDCFYCFNPNQENYKQFKQSHRDVLAELRVLKATGDEVTHLALTGGEPLLHKGEAIHFFQQARMDFPNAHTRLYTSGDHLETTTLKALKSAGLDEIRFSIRMHDSNKARDLTYKNIELAREYIPYVMVEMPVLPGTLEEMKGILLKLEELGVYSVNLLEFCFPLNNAAAFNERGYKIKARPYKVLYNYWYAGGLPIAGSESVCLDLLEFAADQKLKMGVHYCSLENKHTGQVYQQDNDYAYPDMIYVSTRDHFLKSAKVFGEDIPRVKKVINSRGYSAYRMDKENGSMEFDVKKIKLLKEMDVEIGISTSIHEIRDGESVLRELKLDVTTPRSFKLSEI
jgi:pyruvate formate-lyase activating enzyme-like uncharacterized protein